MNRLLLTIAGETCPFGCKYCFAKFSQYRSPISLQDVEKSPSLLDGIDVIYPACDIDFFALTEAPDLLWRLSALKRSISISTKARLSTHMAQVAGAVHAILLKSGAVLKVSVSISTKYKVCEIEPGTSSYKIRLENLRRLAANYIPSSVVLKPILIDIPPSEYAEIVQDAADLSRIVLLGDEYLDSSFTTGRVANGIETVTKNRAVAWAVGHPIWPIRASREHIPVIKAAIANVGGMCFDSDLDVMSFLCQEVRRIANGRQREVEVTTCH